MFFPAGFVVGVQRAKGASMSLTVTVKLQLETLPASSRAVPVTMVRPFGKIDPEGGLQVTVTFPQLSAAFPL